MRIFLIWLQVVLLFPLTVYAGEVTVTEGEVTSGNEPATNDVNSRLDRLEQFMNSSALLDMLDVLEQLKLEVSELRGKIEVQTHSIEQIQNKQRELYTDIDSRLQKLESGNTVVSPTIVDELPETNTTETTDTNVETVEGEPAEVTESAATEIKEIDPVKAQAEYQRAFKLLKESRYDQALTAFKKYLEDFPGSEFADNAQYWLGETNFVMQQYDKAINEYQALLEGYPESQKVSHAMLKIGYSYAELGNADDAEKTLTEVKAKFPGTTAARLAGERLRKIQQSQESNT